MTAVCINIYMTMFNLYIIALACFDGYARAARWMTIWMDVKKKCKKQEGGEVIIWKCCCQCEWN